MAQNIVAVLLSCFTHDVEHVEVGKRGREIALYAKINDYRFTFIKTQVKFFESLKLRIRKFADENIIIAGNLNCCLTRKDKKRGRPTKQKKQLIDSILSLTNSINLVDRGENFILTSHFSPGITNHQLFSVGLIIGWCQNIYFYM